MIRVYFRRLRDMREDADLKQKDIAEYLGIQQTVYSRYERGFQTIPLEYLIKLADYYEVSLDYLVGRSDVTVQPHRGSGDRPRAFRQD